VKSEEFDASTLGGEAPVDGSAAVIALLLPGGDFAAQGRAVGDAAAETLAAEALSSISAKRGTVDFRPLCRRSNPLSVDRMLRPRFLFALLALLHACGLGGCLAAAVVTGVGALAVATVSTAGRVAGATVSAGGKVASSVISASSDVSDAGVKAAARLSRDGMVVFFDPRSGAAWQVPWAQGLKLLAATQAAPIGPALQAARIIRGAQIIMAAKPQAADLLMKSGDVVELAQVPRV